MTDEFRQIVLEKAQEMINLIKKKYEITFTEIAKELNISPRYISYLRQPDHWHMIGRKVVMVFADLVNHNIEFRNGKFFKQGKPIGKMKPVPPLGEIQTNGEDSHSHVSTEQPILTEVPSGMQPIILNRVIENLDFWDLIKMVWEKKPDNVIITITSNNPCTTK